LPDARGSGSRAPSLGILGIYYQNNPILGSLKLMKKVVAMGNI